MKQLSVFLLLVLLASLSVQAQRTGYVDTQSIMDKLPEYVAAQDEVERISEKWQKDLEAQYQAIEQMYADYQANEVLMPEDMKAERQEDIFKAEREAKEFREKKFGYNGELFALQESKIRPIQDKVFKAIEKVAKRKRYDFVFDKAGEVNWLYTNAIFDLSQLVLEELGIKTDEK